jgi:probable HAF family extracellular repeat protein
MTDLHVPSTSGSYANSVNDQGDICGYFTSSSGMRGFIRSGNTTTTLTGFGGNTWGFGINNNGQVAGRSVNAQSKDRAYLYSSGDVYQDLGSLPNAEPAASAFALNAAGIAVGEVAVNNVVNSNRHPAIFNGSTITDLGTFGGNTGRATAINASGVVVGVADTSVIVNFEPNQHAFRYASGNKTDLGTIGGRHSFAEAINSGGQIVGESNPLNSTAYHAVLWNQGVIVDLNSLIDPTSGWVLEGATGINDSGMIVGWGSLNGAQHGWAIVVPEPSLCVFAAAALLATITRRRRP